MKNNKGNILVAILAIIVVILTVFAVKSFTNPSIDEEVSTTESTTAVTFPQSTTAFPTTSTPPVTTTEPSIETTSPSTTIYVTTTVPTTETTTVVHYDEPTVQDDTIVAPTTTVPNTSTPSNNQFININNSQLMFEENKKVMCLTKGVDITATDIKEIHNILFEESKTNINEYCTIEDVKTYLKKADTMDGFDSYFVVGSTNTRQFGKSYIVTATMTDGNSCYNVTIVYTASMSLADILENATNDLTTFTEMME